MDNSFTLSSSVFSKITRSNKKCNQRKVPTKLALKKNVRRSSIFNDLPSTSRNNNLKLVESESSETATSSSNLDMSPSNNIINNTPITISDTDSIKSDNSNCNKESSSHVEVIRQKRSSCMLSTSKYNAIEKWISEIDLATNTDSTYQPDNVRNAGVKKQNLFEFDEMLSSLKDTLKAPTSNKENVVNKNLRVNGDESECSDNEVLVISSSDIVEESDDDNLDLKEQNKKSTPNRVQRDLLGGLYDNQWKRGSYLPRSEPRRKNIKDKMDDVSKTERKSKPKKSLLYKNPYLDSQQKQTSLFSEQNKKESPWVKFFKGLCDTESSEHSSNRASGLLDGISKLSLSDDESAVKGVKKDFKENKLLNLNTKEEIKLDVQLEVIDTSVHSDKENFSDFSISSETLEDRLRKKLNLEKKTAVSTRKNIKKIDNVLKINDDNNLALEKKEGKTDNKFVGKTNILKTNLTPSIGKKNKKQFVNDLINKTPNLKNTNNSDGTVLKSFLASLSGIVKPTECDPSALIFRNNFKMYKNELAAKLFKLYNKEIFNSCIPEDSPIEWSDRMRGTAGYCYCKKIIRRTGVTERSIRIVLATKVLDSADRLRDTLVHEMCHAATWIINKVANGHGNEWQGWTIKARQVFPELPPIKVCHNYNISTKYTYKCTNCFYSFGRHSKSVDIEKKRCGHCYGKFEIFINKTLKNGETKSVPVTPKKAVTGFALFVKENYALCKTPQLSHAQVMKLLGVKFNELRISISKDCM